jgi:nicotinamide-nucleotide amidase
LAEAEALLGDVTVAYLPGLEGVDLRLTIRDAEESVAENALAHAEGILLPKLADSYYGAEATTLASTLIRSLSASQKRLAVAESCTGGLIGSRLTEVPGASQVFAGGIICYENESKIRDLGVSGDLIAKHGAVSEPVARAMVDGICERFDVHAGIAVTGIAGPGGGTAEKPVGTIWLAAKVGRTARTVSRWFPGERHEVRERGAQAALDLLRRILRSV